VRSDIQIADLVDSVAEGVDVDWGVVADTPFNDSDRHLIKELRVVAGIAQLHRALSVDTVQATSLQPAAVGARWGELRLIERIGTGAFGEVYLARDERLDRLVALKLLRNEIASNERLSAQLLNEARILARVKHPNVVVVHGADSHDRRAGFWMEHVAGETLEDRLAAEGPLSADEAASVGRQVCRALAAVHIAGLIHRDVKARNIVRERGGRLVLMDFGAGMTLEQASNPLLSRIGTPAYLAPETLAGAPATIQSDLYSVGVLLYHLVTARYPYDAATVEQMHAAHRSPPTPLVDLRPDLPSAFVRVVEQALAPVERRFKTAGEMAAALDETRIGLDRPDTDARARRYPGDGRSASEGVVVDREGSTNFVVAPGSGRRWSRRRLLLGFAAAIIACSVVGMWYAWRRSTLDPRSIRSIAVLPLTNLSGDPGQDYFADGMTEALIDNLAKVRALRVISRTSSMQFKGSKRSLRDIAKALGVDAVLEGSIVRSGDRVRISADLVHAASDRHVWVNSYERDVRDVLALQADVALSIAREVQIQLTPVEEAGFGGGQPVNVAAQEAYLRGRYFWNKRSSEGLQKALEYFRQAASIDPSFARAYAGQADVYNLLPGRMAPAMAYPLAKEAAARALKLDPTLAEAHTSLAFAAFIFDRDWAAAEAGYKRALQINPSYATAHHWYGEFLGAMGRLDEGLAQLREAQAIDPLSSSIRTSLGGTLYLARRQDDAIAEFQASLAIDADNPSTYLQLALAYLQKGLLDDAKTTVDRGLDRVGATDTLLRLTSAAVDALKGRRADALSVLNELAARGPEISRPGELISYVYICLGDTDRAFEALRSGEQAGAPGLLWAKVDPIFDGLRTDARFRDLLRRLRLEP
jgi:serine/threonine protein kinase/tetratricopeptide (TPR) repeat protein